MTTVYAPTVPADGLESIIDAYMAVRIGAECPRTYADRRRAAIDVARRAVAIAGNVRTHHGYGWRQTSAERLAYARAVRLALVAVTGPASCPRCDGVALDDPASDAYVHAQPGRRIGTDRPDRCNAYGTPVFTRDAVSRTGEHF